MRAINLQNGVNNGTQFNLALCQSHTKNTLKQFACVQGKEKKATKGKKNEVWVEKF